MDREVQINDVGNSRAKSHRGSRENRGILRRQAQPNILIKAQDIFFLCLRNWKWFVLSLGICFAIAYYQIQKTPNVYYRSLSLMIKGEDANTASQSTALKALGIEMPQVNVSNEIMAIRSSDVARAVAERLNLDVEYVHEGPFHDEVAYGRTLPVKVAFHDLEKDESANFILTLNNDSTVILSNIVRNGNEIPGAIRMRLGQTRRTSLGVISLIPTTAYFTGMEDRLIVRRLPIDRAAGFISGRMQASPRSRETTLIDIGYTDFSTERAEDILSTLVEVYNENWIKDQNQIMYSTNEFIKERLLMIEGELSQVENRIADYKSENLMPNVEAVGARAVGIKQSAEDTNEQIDNQVYMIGYLRAYITDGHHNNQLLPTNMGIGSANIESQVSEYNRIMMQRNGYLAHSSEQNPLVMDLEESMEILKDAIIQSLDNELVLLQNRREKSDKKRDEAIEKIIANPGQSIYVKSIERQQKVKEELYMFLLKKREENELSQTFTAYNCRLIEPPHGSTEPISPIPQQTYLLAFIIGFGIPASVLIIKEGFNTVVRGRKDIEQLSIPFVGEIPLDSRAAKRAEKMAKEKKKRRKKGIHGVDTPPELVVVEKSRNVMNEAFRVVRSNLEFILGFDSGHHIIMVTSLNPSSGKTFCTANLASSLGINNKKVIAVDLDMRKGSLSKYVGRPPRGVSNYLSGQLPDYQSLIITIGNIDVLPCGTIPPNPTELLYSPQFKKMLKELRDEYDYVFLDCPPVEVVADAAIINRYADMTLFIIRAQLMDRAFLPDLEHWYEDRRYNNLSILLNGTTDAFSRYGYHRYGYRYGYHYGNYGYGYGNDKE